MNSRYRVTSSVRAILDKPAGGRVSVTLPVGAVLYDSSPHSSTLFGMVGVVWGGRHYSIYPKDLHKKTERFFAA
jgi:hypothetical protein